MGSTRNTVMTVFVFLILVVLISVPVFNYVKGAQQGNFTVTLWLTNSLPSVTWVNDTVSVIPIENGIRTAYIHFNATDTNGASDLNDSTATITLSFSGEPQRYNTSCTPAGNPGDTETYTCAIDLQYYDRDGAWTINASIYDNAGAYAENLTFTMTYDPLAAMILWKSSLNFTNAAIGEQNKASDQNPQIIDNRGNQNITQVNVTAFDLVKGGETIAATQFTMNATDGSGAGYTLQNNTMVDIQNAIVARDIGGSDSNASLYLYVDVPAAGLTQGQFDSSSNWLVDVQ